MPYRGTETLRAALCPASFQRKPCHLAALNILFSERTVLSHASLFPASYSLCLNAFLQLRS